MRERKDRRDSSAETDAGTTSPSCVGRPTGLGWDCLSPHIPVHPLIKCWGSGNLQDMETHFVKYIHILIKNVCFKYNQK